MSSPALPSSNAVNLKRLNGLRLIVLAAELVAVWLAVTRWHLPLPLVPLFALFFTVAVAGALTIVRLRLGDRISDGELFFHLTVDVLALTVLLYLTGGSGNPLAPFYLLPLTLTAAALPGGFTWAMVALTMSCYTLLHFFFVPLPAVHAGHADHVGATGLHELGMWLGFVFSALLIAAFAVRMSRSVRERDRMIAALHEQQLQHEHVLALGTLAASAAHELGTPLSTMAVVLNDVEADAPLGEMELKVLRDQVDRCKGILGSLAATAGDWRAESGKAVELESYLSDLVDRWRQSRPTIEATVSLSGSEPSPRLVMEQTLEHALLNVFNNAADASPRAVTINASWDNDALMIEVLDRGSGLTPDLREQVGTAGLSTKQDGMGLGLFLSYHALQRFGGEVSLSEREGGGARCRIRIPLGELRIADG